MIGEDYHIDDLKRRHGLWPLWGALTLIACGVIGRVLAPMLYDYIRRSQPNFSIGTLGEEEVLWFFTLIIGLVLVAIIALIIAVAAPKRRIAVSEKQLAKQRVHNQAVERAKKKRMREINRKMREQNKTSGT